MQVRLIFLSIVILFCIDQSNAQDRLNDKIPMDKDVRVGVLKNGFRYYLNYNDSLDGKLAIYFLVKAGEEQERRDQIEFAHLLEHVALNSTSSFSDIRTYLSNQGLIWGKDYNASTGAKITKYRFFIPDDSPVLLRSCLRIIQDWSIGKVTFTDNVINAERGAVLQEIARKSSDVERVNKTVIANVMGLRNHNGRIELDSRKSLQTMSNSSLADFYREWYTPNREAIVVSGKFNVDSLEIMIGRMFSGVDVKHRLDVAIGLYDQPMKLDGRNNFYCVPSSDTGKFDIKIFFKNKFRPVVTYRDFRDQLLKRLLSSLIDSRFQSVSDLSGSTNSYYNAEASSFGRPFSSIVVNARGDLFNLKMAYIATMRELYRVSRSAFTEEEVEAAKSWLIKDLTIGYRRNKDLDIYDYIENMVAGEPIPSRKDKFGIAIRLLEEVKVSDIQIILNSISLSKNRDVSFVVPSGFRCSSVNEDSIERWNYHAEKASFSPIKYVQQENLKSSNELAKAMPPLMSVEQIEILKADASSFVIDSIKSISAVSVKLSNGIRVVLKSTYSGGDVVYVRGVKRISTFSTDANDSVLTKYAPYLISNSGPRRYGSDEWVRYKRQKGIKIMHEANRGGVMISAYSKASNLEDILQVIRLSIVDPAIDIDVLNTWKDQQRELLDKRKSLSKPIDNYVEALRDGFGFSRSILSVALLDNVTMNGMISKYNDLYANDGGYVFFVVGKFDQSYILGLINQYIGTIPVGLNSSRPFSKREVGVVLNSRSTFYDESHATSRVDMLFPSVLPFSACSDLMMETLKGEFGKSIVARLRSKEGVSYSPRVNFSKSWMGNERYFLTVSFDCATNKIDEAVGFVKEELIHLQKTKMQDNVVITSRNTIKEIVEKRIEDPLFLADYFSESILKGIDLDQMNDCMDVVNEITPDSIFEVANTFLAEDPVVFIFRGKSQSVN